MSELVTSLKVIQARMLPKDGIDLLAYYQQSLKDILRWMLQLDKQQRSTFLDYIDQEPRDDYSITDYLNKNHYGQLLRVMELIDSYGLPKRIVAYMRGFMMAKYTLNVEYIAFETKMSHENVCAYYFTLLETLNIASLRKYIGKLSRVHFSKYMACIAAY